jgi:phosphate-selective porin
MNLLWGTVLALGVASAARADGEAERDLERRLGVAVPASPQDAEMERLRRMAEQEKKKELEELPERVSKLEKQVAQQQPTWDPAKMLSFDTPDGNFTAKIGGRIFFIYRHIFDVQDGSGAIGSPPALLAGRGGDPDTFGIDTVRMMLEGTFFKDFFYRAEAEAQSQADAGRFRMKDLYMGWHALPDILSIGAGQQKTPWSQEETTSSRFIDFGERSILNRLAPAHDVGILVKGSLADRVLEWNLGVFNGALARDQGRNATDFNSEKDLVGRLFVTPLKGSFTRLFQQLRLGLDFTWGPRDTQALGGGITTGDLGPTLVNPFDGPVTQADGTQSR